MAPLISNEGSCPSRWWRNLEHHRPKSKPISPQLRPKAQKIHRHPDLSKGAAKGAFQILFVFLAAGAHNAGDVVVIIVVIGQEGVIFIVAVVIGVVDTGQQLIGIIIGQFLVAHGVE